MRSDRDRRIIGGWLGWNPCERVWMASAEYLQSPPADSENWADVRSIRFNALQSLEMNIKSAELLAFHLIGDQYLSLRKFWWSWAGFEDTLPPQYCSPLAKGAFHTSVYLALVHPGLLFWNIYMLGLINPWSHPTLESPRVPTIEWQIKPNS